MREISDVIHTMFRTEMVRVTITGVNVTPDLRSAIVFYSVIGGDQYAGGIKEFIKRRRGIIQTEVGKRIVLKYLPELKFIYDDSIERGARVIELIEELTGDEDVAKDEGEE